MFSKESWRKSECTHQVSCYHSSLVEIIAESVNLIQMSKQKTIITMMENNQVLIKKYISKHRAESFILQETNDSNLLRYRKNGTQDTGPYEDAGPMRIQSPRRTEDPMMTQSPMRTPDPRRTHDPSSTQEPMKTQNYLMIQKRPRNL